MFSTICASIVILQIGNFFLNLFKYYREIRRDIISRQSKNISTNFSQPVIQISFRCDTNCVYRCARRECRSLARSIFDVDVTARAISECVPRDNSDCQVATISRILSQIRQSPRATGERIKMHPIGRIREIEKKRGRADGRKKGRKYYRRFVSLSVTTH